MFNIKVSILGITAQQTVSVASATSAREIFKMAGMDVSGNYLVKLDGRQIDLDTIVDGGNMLIATAQIKGN